VRKYSDDASSTSKGGALPTFGSGAATRMVPAFEDAAFELKNDGDFSAPLRTDFGYHIIKRIKWNPVPGFDEMKKELEGRVSRDSRSKLTQASFVEKLKKEYAFTKKNDKPVYWFENVLDSTYFMGKFDAASVKAVKPIFTLDGKKFTQKDFALYLEKNYRSASRSMSEREMLLDQYQKWEKEAILDYEESKLATKYPAYKALLTEYHDGILLYEVMSDLVWNKAMKDTTGLRNYFEANKSKYMWDKRLDAEVLETNDRKYADQAYAALKSGKSVADVVKEINKESELNIRQRSGKFDAVKSKFFEGQSLSKGLNAVYQIEEKYYVVVVNDVLEPSQKEFFEAKGAVTSDYQSQLEQDWLAELNKKYPIVINEAELYNIGK
jgi:peptidyl-prolyl cis-trans isomerase SurA